MAMRNFSIRMDKNMINDLKRYGNLIFQRTGQKQTVASSIRFLLANNKNLHPKIVYVKLDQLEDQRMKNALSDLTTRVADIQLKENGVGNNTNQLAKKVNSGELTNGDEILSKLDLINRDHENINGSLAEVINDLNTLKDIVFGKDIDDIVTQNSEDFGD